MAAIRSTDIIEDYSEQFDPVAALRLIIRLKYLKSCLDVSSKRKDYDKIFQSMI